MDCSLAADPWVVARPGDHRLPPEASSPGSARQDAAERAGLRVCRWRKRGVLLMRGWSSARPSAVQWAKPAPSRAWPPDQVRHPHQRPSSPL